VIAKLPLDSPYWNELDACQSVQNAVEHLRAIVTTRQLGESWSELQDEIIHQGTVYGATSAALPHLVDLGAELPPNTLSDFWVEIGLLVAAGADTFDEEPPVEGLQEGLTESVASAEVLALRSYLSTVDLSPVDAGYHALACLAFAGHPTGFALWQFLSPVEGYVNVLCPGCEAEYEVDGFGDPVRPPSAPPPAPELSDDARSVPEWQEVAAAIEVARRTEVLGPGWDGFFRVAGGVAEAGVPEDTPEDAAWCLVVAMIAAKGGAPWARTIARLAGHFQCDQCDEVWNLADVLGDGNSDAEPLDISTLDAATVADGAGFKPAPGPRVASDLTVEQVWRGGEDHGPVDAMTIVTLADGRTVLVAGGPDGSIRRYDPATGTPQGDQIAGRVGPVSSLAAATLPDGQTLLAAAGDAGALDWWDVATGRPLGDPVSADAAGVVTMTMLVMPAENSPLGNTTGSWLAPLRDGRTVLVTGSADGTVRLWDPVGRTVLGELFGRAGQPVTGMTVVSASDEAPASGPSLVTAYGDRTVDVWSSAAVTGERSTMAPAEEKLAAAGHEQVAMVAAAPGSMGSRSPILLGDRNGAVSLWETFGVRLTDPLRPEGDHENVAMAALALPDGRLVAATASAATAGGASLRLWDLTTGGVQVTPLDVVPRCLTAIGSQLAVGHDTGVLMVSIQP
jgi:WD40 repeat protein